VELIPAPISSSHRKNLTARASCAYLLLPHLPYLPRASFFSARALSSSSGHARRFPAPCALLCSELPVCPPQPRLVPMVSGVSPCSLLSQARAQPTRLATALFPAPPSLLLAFPMAGASPSPDLLPPARPSTPSLLAEMLLLQLDPSSVRSAFCARELAVSVSAVRAIFSASLSRHRLSLIVVFPFPFSLLQFGLAQCARSVYSSGTELFLARAVAIFPGSPRPEVHPWRAPFLLVLGSHPERVQSRSLPLPSVQPSSLRTRRALWRLRHAVLPCSASSSRAESFSSSPATPDVLPALLTSTSSVVDTVRSASLVLIRARLCRHRRVVDLVGCCRSSSRRVCSSSPRSGPGSSTRPGCASP
jgi:hypothetical protein